MTSIILQLGIGVPDDKVDKFCEFSPHCVVDKKLMIKYQTFEINIEKQQEERKAEINRLLALSNGDIAVHSTIKLLSSHGLNEKPCQCKLAAFRLTNKGCCGSTTVP